MTNDEIYDLLIERLDNDPRFYTDVIIRALTNSMVPMEEIFSDFKERAEFNRKAMGARKLELADKERLENLRLVKEWEQTPDNHFTVKDIPDEVMKIVQDEDKCNSAWSFCSIMDDLVRLGKKRRDVIKLNGEYHFNRDGMLRVIDWIWDKYHMDRELMWPWKLKYIYPDEDE